jgi:triosephosphate isomerase (TIM)
MYFSYPAASRLLKEYVQKLPRNPNIRYIICPSFDALTSCGSELTGTSFMLGAQNCSAYPSGAHTGQVSAESLAHIGCSYCIIGHSEVRFSESNTLIAAKAEELLRHNISPIVCIGEDETAYNNKNSFDVVKKQLEVLYRLLQAMPKIACSLLIAYEPQWAIGTGKVPSNQELTEMFAYIHTIVKDHTATPIKLLYGGSVTQATAFSIYTTEHIEGFLIGKASTNFQELKNIVDLLC